MRVQHIMSLNPIACDADQTVEECARLMRDRATGAVVVLEGREVVGLVTDRLLATRGFAEGVEGSAPVSDIMIRDVACVSPDDSVFAAIDTMRSSNLARRLPVVGPSRELLGIVSISDIAVVAKDLIDAVLAEETQHSLKRTRALTGGKRVVKKIRRPTKVDRLPDDLPLTAKRGPSRPGVVRDPIPRGARRKANPALAQGAGPGRGPTAADASAPARGTGARRGQTTGRGSPRYGLTTRAARARAGGAQGRAGESRPKRPESAYKRSTRKRAARRDPETGVREPPAEPANEGPTRKGPFAFLRRS